jgi:hypothetical protein
VGGENVSTIVEPRESFDAPLINRRPLVSRRRRPIRTAVVVLCVLIAFAGGSMLVKGGRSTVVPRERVVEQFRAMQTTEDVLDFPSPAKAERAESVRTRPQPQQREVGSVRAATPKGPYRPPTPGVYSYRAKGGDKLSVFGAEHRYPERVYATISHAGGCAWQVRLDVIEEHVDEVHLCSKSGALETPEQTRAVEFFGVRQAPTMWCDPPIRLHTVGDKPGAADKYHCTDRQGGTAKIRRTFIGIETVTVGTSKVDAVHVRTDSVTTGRANGTSSDDLWLSVDTGLPYRWKRHVDVKTAVFSGMDTRYTEDADFVLEALKPIS